MDPICERLLTQKTILYLQEKPMRFLARQGNFGAVCPHFVRQHPHVFLCSKIPKFEISPSHFFWVSVEQSNSHPSHRDTFVFIKVNPLVVVPRVHRAIALIFDRLFFGSDDLSSVLEESHCSPPRRETKKSIDIVYWSTNFGCREFPLPL